MASVRKNAVLFTHTNQSSAELVELIELSLEKQLEELERTRQSIKRTRKLVAALKANLPGDDAKPEDAPQTPAVRTFLPEI